MKFNINSNFLIDNNTKVREKLKNGIYVLEKDRYSFLYNTNNEQIISECFLTLSEFESGVATFEIPIPYMSKKPTNTLIGVIDESGDIVDHVIEYNNKTIYDVCYEDGTLDDGSRIWTLKNLIEELEKQEIIKNHYNASYREVINRGNVKAYIR